MLVRNMKVYTDPAVLLSFPLRGVLVHEGPAGAVGELEEAGEHAVVLGRVWEDGVLEVDAVGDDAVVFIHPEGQTETLWSYK